MSFRVLPFVLALTAAGSAILAQEPKSADDEPLAPEVRTSVDQLVRTDKDPREEYGPIWRACCSSHGSVEPLLTFLTERVRDESNATEKDQLRRLLCRIHRRAGQLDRALRVLSALETDRRTVADEIARAEIFDALGRDKDALGLYDALLSRELAPAAKKKILLRRALMGKGVDGLAAFAKNEKNTPELRNEAAVILALRGDQKTAIDNFVASGEGTSRFRQEIRRAEWAMDAKLFDDAQAAAELAVEHAKLSRDRKYALSVLASAYRRDGAVSELLAKFEKAKDLQIDARKLWVRLLREEGRADDALRLFNAADTTSFDASMRRQLLEICRETGRAGLLVDAFQRLIREDTTTLEWRSGLSRHYLEQGKRKQAIEVWNDIETSSPDARSLMEAAFSLEAIGLDDVAEKLARQASKDEDFRSLGLLFIFRMHLEKGDQDAALAVLKDLDHKDASSGVRASVADGYERLGRADLAVATLEDLRNKLGGYLGSDLEMKFAIQLSRVNREAEALKVWRGLWSKLRSTPRGRFVEDRMMTVASRTGTLAKIAIELEDRLAKGDVDTEGVELLVRLYIKVGDPASATEIVEEFMKQSGTAEAEVLKRKAKIYLACQDYHHYEKVIHELVEKDVENRLDHLRELAMSQLERGRRDLTVALLPRIREESGDDAQMADEFEAGVYGLCGMQAKALEAYVKGMGRNPGRIDTYLLISNLMRETGGEMDAARMFQYLAQTADKDDLFTIAIDGILNLRAQRGTRVPPSVVSWALRTTLERLATKPDKFYLYRLVTDLAAELNDMPLAIRTLKSGLPVAGERRTPIMREVMSKAQSMDPASRRVIGGQNIFKPSANWDATDYIMVGRRLLGQGDHVPPQTFMNLATVFIRENDVEAAMRTFNRAAEVLEYAEVLREAARVLEDTGRPKQALGYYQRLLAAGADDVGLILKIGSLQEQLGDTSRAFEFYHRGMEQILARKPRYITHAEKKKTEDPYRFIGRSVSVEDEALPKFIDGMVLNASEEEATKVLGLLRVAMDEDLETVPADPGTDAEQHTLGNYPRLAARSEVWRRLVLSRRKYDVADEFDKTLLARFAKDQDVSLKVLASRSDRGLESSSRNLLELSPFKADPAVRLAAGAVSATETSLSVAAAARLVVPNLGSDLSTLRDVMERVDTGVLTDTDKSQLQNLLAACVLVGARDPAERFARAGVRSADIAGVGVTTFQTVLNMAARLSPKLAKSLLREKMTNVARSKPSSLGSFIHFFSEIDASLGGGSLTSDAAKSLILSLAKGVDRSRPYFYFTVLLSSVNSEERPALVKELHNLLSPSQRPRLLLDCVNYLGDGKIEESFEDWYGQSLKVALEAGGENVVNAIILPPVGRGAASDRSDQLALKALEVLDSFRPNPRNAAERVGALVEMGKIDDAFQMAEKSVHAILADRQLGTYAFQQMMRYLTASKQSERVTSFLRKSAKAYPNSIPIKQAMWQQLLAGDPAVYRQELESGLVADPKNVDLLNRLRNLEQQEGWQVRAARRLEELVRAQPGNRTYDRWLKNAWRALLHPKHFETAKRPGNGRRPAGRGGRGARAARAAGRVASVAATRVVSTGLMSVSIAGTAGGRPIRVDPPGRQILKLHESGKKDEARRAFRRYWRNFDATSRYIVFPQNLRPNSFRQFEGKLPYLADEVRLVLQVLGGRGMPQTREEMFDILARDIQKRGDAKALVEKYVASVLAGTANTDDVEVLLRLLDNSEAESVDEKVMTALVNRSELLDAGRLKRLAKLCVKGGELERATQLYRLAVLSDPTSSSTLVREAKEIEKLFGDSAKSLLLELVADLSVNTQRFQFVNWANTAVDIWARILPPEEAAQQMLGLKETIRRLAGASPYVGKRTPRGDLVAATFARAGMTDEALAELEMWLSSGAPEPNVYNRVRIQPMAAVQRALDASGEWTDRSAWLRALAPRLLAWHAEGKLLAPIQVLGAMSKELWKDGVPDLATKCVDGLGNAGSNRPVDRLARARALRGIEFVKDAQELEVELLGEECLPVNMIADAVKYLIERDGAEAGLKAGTAATEYTWTPDLLELLAATAEQLGRADEAKAWLEKKAKVDAVLPKPAKGPVKDPAKKPVKNPTGLRGAKRLPSAGTLRVPAQPAATKPAAKPAAKKDPNKKPATKKDGAKKSPTKKDATKKSTTGNGAKKTGKSSASR